jgi:hypothetical protein
MDQKTNCSYQFPQLSILRFTYSSVNVGGSIEQASPREGACKHSAKLIVFPAF